MIEIVFSGSACGNLQAAMHYGEGELLSSVTSTFVLYPIGSEQIKDEIDISQFKDKIDTARQEAKERERLLLENSKPIGGNLSDVFGFDLLLSMGDISDDRPGTRRQEVLEQSHSLCYKNSRKQTVQRLIQKANDNLDAVFKRALLGEPLRIWYSNQPDELCGFYWFMAQLKRLENRLSTIYLIQLPDWITDEKGTSNRLLGWGNIHPGEWHSYLDLQRIAPPVVCQSCAAHWDTLQKENAPLRAMVNGQLVSVPETFYDDFITREIATEDDIFSEAAIIVSVLSKYKFGSGDFWAAHRIEEMIRAGKLEAVTEPAEYAPIYYRKLKKCVKFCIEE